MLALRELQRRFYRALVRPHGPAGDAALDPELLRHIAADAVLAARDRIDIYAGMYCARLVEVLSEDFPQVLARLGPERFHDLAHTYLDHHPSTHPSVRHLGAAFADFLAHHESVDVPPFVPDLARLERMRLDVFDAADAAVLTLEELRLTPPQEWGALRFQLIPALGLLESPWPVHEIWASGGKRDAQDWRPSPVALRVWRQGVLVYQAAMDDDERLALACVQRTAPFAELCEELGQASSPAEAARQAAALVLRWVEDGLLRNERCHAPGESGTDAR